MIRRHRQVSRPPLEVRDITSHGQEVQVEIMLGDKIHQVYFQSDGHPLRLAPEALLPLTLYIAMRRASSLRLEGDLDPLLFANLPVIQDRMKATGFGFSRVPVEGLSPAPISPLRPARVALFFSCGLDSWYSLLEHQDEITDLVFVSGTDIPLSNPAHLEKSIKLVRQVAGQLGKNVITIRTNMRDFTDRYIEWHNFLDSLMQTLAHLLGGDFTRVYLASPLSAADMIRYGVDPTVVALWSTSSLQVVYDSLDVDRVVKAVRVGQEQVALDNLRVCWKNPPVGLNCGVCEKCLRTMINLEAAGALDRCHVFNQPLDLKRVSRQFIKDDNLLYNTEKNLAAVIAAQGESQLARAMRRSMRSSVYKRWLRSNFDWVYTLYVRLRHWLTRNDPDVFQHRR